MITARDIGGNEDLALRVLATARSIAPRIHDLPAGDLRDQAVAILRGVATEGGKSSRVLKGQRVGPAGVDYNQVSSWFSDDDRAGLRALCDANLTSPGSPIGRFPTGGLVSNLWAESYND